MPLLDLFDHLLNFLAPAFGVGFLTALMAPLALRRRPAAPRWWVQGALNFGVGAVVLAGGLVVFGHDGMMATYAALVLACASSQWLMSCDFRG